MDVYQLKIWIFVEGIQLTEACIAALPKSRFGRFTFQDYPTTGGLVLRLDENTYVNAPIRYTGGSPFTLDHEGEKGFLLLTLEERRYISILFPPRFALDAAKLADGSLVTDFVMAHADRVRLEPVGGCGFHCDFCTMPTAPYRLSKLEKFKEAMDVALKDPLLNPRHALISGGTPKTALTDYRHCNAALQRFPAFCPELEFDLMVAPRTLTPGVHTRRKYRSFLNYVLEARITGVSINLELFGAKTRRSYVPEKDQIGIDNYLAFIEEAVAIFGQGAVRSSLIVGLEHEKDTLAGVTALAERGCLPVLSPFIAAPGTFLSAYPSPNVEALSRLAERAKEIAEQHGLFLGPVCKPCTHNCL